MKKIVYGLLLSLLPVLGFAHDNTLLTTEISIRPLELGLSAKGGVLGTEAQIEINGKKAVQGMITLTGQMAEDLINEVNKDLEQAGKTTQYVFNKTTDMVVMSGKLAEEILSKSAKNGMKLLQDGSELAQSGARTVYYNTVMLTEMTRVHAKYALEVAADVGGRGLKALYGEVKFISKEAQKLSQDIYSLTVKSIKNSIELSKNLIIQGSDSALALANSALVLVTDTGIYLYNNAGKEVLKVAKMTADGAYELAQDIKSISIDSATAAAHFIKNVYENIPRVSITVEIK